MEKKTFTLTSDHDGLTLSCLMTVPDGKPVGIVQLCHGMAEHKERYEDFMRFLSEQGFVAVINDHRGHGKSIRSEEDFGYFYKDGAMGVINDTHQVTRHIKKEFPDIPFFLFGHSMGSLIVRSYLKRYDHELNALIVCGSPSANPVAGVGKFLCKMIGLFQGDHYHSPFLINMTTGGFGKGIEEESPSAWLSYNKDNYRKYDADPRCGFPFTANGYETLMTVMADCYSKKGWQITKPSLPIHFIAGEEDPCIGNKQQFENAVAFLKERGYETVTSKLYPHMRHEILNETENTLVYQDVTNFLMSCL